MSELFIFAVLDDDAAKVARISTAYLASPAGADETSRRKWDAFVEYEKIVLDKGGSLTRLKTIAEKLPAIGIVWANLARAYRQYDEHLSAARAFEQAITAETDTLPRIRFLGEAAVEYYKTGNRLQAETLLAHMRDLGEAVPERQAAILVAELEFADAVHDSQVYLGCLERLLEIDPGNTDRRFRLAYKYADMDMDDVALFHYTKIPRSDRGQGNWNNLGVTYGQVGLPGLSISAFREAEKIGETLAMANLAGRLTEAGFFDEAGNILTKAVRSRITIRM